MLVKKGLCTLSFASRTLQAAAAQHLRFQLVFSSNADPRARSASNADPSQAPPPRFTQAMGSPKALPMAGTAPSLDSHAVSPRLRGSHGNIPDGSSGGSHAGELPTTYELPPVQQPESASTARGRSGTLAFLAGAMSLSTASSSSAAARVASAAATGPLFERLLGSMDAALCPPLLLLQTSSIAT